MPDKRYWKKLITNALNFWKNNKLDNIDTTTDKKLNEAYNIVTKKKGNFDPDRSFTPQQLIAINTLLTFLKSHNPKFLMHTKEVKPKINDIDLDINANPIFDLLSNEINQKSDKEKEEFLNFLEKDLAELFGDLNLDEDDYPKTREAKKLKEIDKMLSSTQHLGNISPTNTPNTNTSSNKLDKPVKE